MPVALSAPLSARLIATLAQLGFDRAQGVLGVRGVLGLAVSGGSDSLALMLLAHEAGLKLRVATVDHGLRPEAASEAQNVAAQARVLGLDHDILQWRGWDGRGNIQDRARRARRALLAQWAQDHGLTGVALAHTQNDLAEGFVMRLARGAGVDGLSAMPARFAYDGAAFLRPLLWATRAELRAYLGVKGQVWVDDPSNDQDKFHRVRARKALPVLENLGISAQVLAEVSNHLAQARTALDHATADLARAVLTQNAGIITIAPAWRAAPAELQRRLIQRVLLWISPADYAPRGAALDGAVSRLQSGQATQLAGCHFVPNGPETLAFRETKRGAAPCTPCQTWDGVWHWGGADPPNNAEIRALGPQGLALWPNWRDTGFRRAALLSQPSLWAGDRLLSTPLAPSLPVKSAFLRVPAPETLISMRLAD